MRRSSPILPPEEWPEIDRMRWMAAVAAATELDLERDVQVRGVWAIRNARSAYGAWSGWLRERGLADNTATPEDRCLPSRVVEYVEYMQQRYAAATAEHRTAHLERAFAMIAPEMDRRFFKNIIANLRPTKSSRDKRSRLKEPALLIVLGLKLMEAAKCARPQDRKVAVKFRDGLQIALLAARPLRMKNFVGLRIGRHLVTQAGRWRLHIDASETKTKRPIDVSFPEPLVPYLAHYLEWVRPQLADKIYQGDRLWLSWRRQPQSGWTIAACICRHTKAAFGAPINPHLFRDCAATSVAIHDPKHIQITAAVLGHSSLATTQRHYNLARSIDASRTFNSAILMLRRSIKRRARRGLT